MAYENFGVFTLPADDASTMKDYRLVMVDSNGCAAYPDATDLADVTKTVGTTNEQVDANGDIAVRGFDGGVSKITVAANQTVVPGDYLFMAGTVGCVQTGSEGYFVGTALTGGVSGASELAVISAVLRAPSGDAAET